MPIAAVNCYQPDSHLYQPSAGTQDGRALEMRCLYCKQEIVLDQTFGGWYDSTMEFKCRFAPESYGYVKNHAPEAHVVVKISTSAGVL